MICKANRLIAGFLAILMVAAILPADIFAAGPDLTIGTLTELQTFADDVSSGNTYEGKTVVLTANIALGGESSPWTPIGTSANTFKGTFDGNYHVISGLYISSGSYAGLFGYVNGGTVKNLVVDGSVSGSSNVAGIVGYLNAGTVKNCGNYANVTGQSAVGGVAGYVGGASLVSECFNAGNVTGTTGYIGGVTGQHWRAGEVVNCYNVGTVTGPATVGGVTGGHKAASPVLANCYNAGSVIDSKGDNNNIGALVGASKGTNTNCYYIKNTGTDTKDGIREIEILSASILGDAFDDTAERPVLKWESGISTDAPVRPPFTESTELSAALAAYIRMAINSTKTQSGLLAAETLLGNEVYMAGASSTATDWMALAMGRFGYFDASDGCYRYMYEDGDGYEAYLSAMKAYIEKSYQDNRGILHSAKATEWHRAVVAIAALGGNPADFGIYNNSQINLIADGSYNCALKAGPGTQGINGWIWGLIALDTGVYEVPSDAKYTRETFITEILKMQLTDGVNGNEYGGWVLGGYGSSSDVDITAMAIQALAPYYNDDTVYTYTNTNSKKEVSKTVRQCVDEALDCLGSMMSSSGGFSSWDTNNVESISQVVVALCSLGINPAEDTRFLTESGDTLLDSILQFRLSDGGFCHVLSGGWNSMANDQATYALVAYWRLENGMRALYDMRSDWSAEEKAAIETAIHTIDALPAPAAADYKAKLKEALSVFRAVPQDERRYVSNYASLASALELIGGEAALDTTVPYITSVSVTKRPDKTTYYEGDVFDASGMLVTAQLSDGSAQEITDYKLSPSGELTLTDDTVYISYGNLKTSVSITVRERMPWEGEGTEESPYLIKTADDLVDLQFYIKNKNMATSGIHFLMTRDINMKYIEEWTGIAANSNVGFQGHFDGGGHSLWNVNGSSVYIVGGIFAKLGDGALIENLTVASGTIGHSYMYSAAGIAGEILENSTVTIRNCHNYASVYGLWGIGGILGEVQSNGHAIIENCSNHGVITASYTGGGIVGQVGPNRWQNNGAKVTVVNCYNAGSVCGSGSWGNGGIVGNFQLGGTAVVSEIQNCYNAGSVTGSASGSVIGSAEEATVSLKNVYYLETSAPLACGTFTDGGTYEAGTITGAAVSRTKEEMKANAFAVSLGDAFVKDTEAINDGYPCVFNQAAIGEEVPVHAGLEIGTAEELKAFAERVNAGESFTNKSVALTAHIDLSTVSDWTPIGSSSKYQFDGNFDGQGYVIDNLTSSTGGLFGYVGVNAVIKNVGVASGEIGSKSSYSSFMGAIAKWSNGADLINCWNGADVYSGGYSGGIIGTVRDGGESLIKGCYNVGSIYGKDSAIGGIVGHLDTSRNGTSVEVTVEDCYNAGFVTGKYSVGGIIGKAQDGHKIRNCYNVGEIVSETEKEAGAVAGDVTSGNLIENCYYNSDIHSTGIAGGIDTTIGKSTFDMKGGEFLSLLSDSFKEDLLDLVNSGYPLLSWQKTADANAVLEVIGKIDAIGTVTLNSSVSINEARNAYDNLDEELQSHVSNLSALEQAEEAFAAIQTLEQAKNSAKQQLESYMDMADYRTAQQNELAQIIVDGKAAIDAAVDTAAVYKALADAKAEAETVKTDKQLSDEEAANAVSEKINAIGTVTLESEETINAIRSAFNALSDEAKKLVGNYETLTRAEAELDKLKDEADTKSTTDDSQESNLPNTPDKSPQTGDLGNPSLNAAIAAISLLAFVILAASRKRAL